MDELNNNEKNPFDEQDTSNNSPETGTYSQPQQNPGYDPYNQPRQSSDPYNQPQQNVNPYSQPQQNSNPYGQPQQYSNPYGQPQQNSNPYGQPQQNIPYNQPYQQQYNRQAGTYNQQNIPQQGYIPPQYGTPYRQPYVSQNQSTGMAVASLVLGIVSICFSLFMFSFPPLFLVPIIGLVLGIVFKSKHLPVGKGLSTAGIVTSVLGLILPIILVIIMAFILLSYGDVIMDYMRVNAPEEYEYLYQQFGDQFPEWFDGILRFIIK